MKRSESNQWPSSGGEVRGLEAGDSSRRFSADAYSPRTRVHSELSGGRVNKVHPSSITTSPFVSPRDTDSPHPSQRPRTPSSGGGVERPRTPSAAAVSHGEDNRDQSSADRVRTTTSGGRRPSKEANSSNSPRRNNEDRRRSSSSVSSSLAYSAGQPSTPRTRDIRRGSSQCSGSYDTEREGRAADSEKKASGAVVSPSNKSHTGGGVAGGEDISAFRLNKDEEFERQVVVQALNTIAQHRGPRLGSASGTFLQGNKKLTELSLITEHIAIGAREDACHSERLTSMGVTHVLNAASSSLPCSFANLYVYYRLPIEDEEKFNIAKFFRAASSILSRVEELRGRCLVHCIAGVSRSVTLVLAHLMLKHNQTLRDAYAHVHTCRPFICPNKGFQLALAKLEVQLLGATSMANHPEWEFYEWNVIKHSYKTVEELRAGTDCCLLA